MLVITRRINETLYIGDDVQIKIIGTDERGEVKIGIAAPRNIAVHRQEIYDKIKEQESERLL